MADHAPNQTRAAECGAGVSKAGSSSFFEKKEPKKLLSTGGRQRIGTDVAARRNQGEKSFFASFFSKKEDSCLPFLTSLHHDA
jgi:hypothetical protein